MEQRGKYLSPHLSWQNGGVQRAWFWRLWVGCALAAAAWGGCYEDSLLWALSCPRLPPGALGVGVAPAWALPPAPWWEHVATGPQALLGPEKTGRAGALGIRLLQEAASDPEGQSYWRGTQSPQRPQTSPRAQQSPSWGLGGCPSPPPGLRAWGPLSVLWAKAKPWWLLWGHSGQGTELAHGHRGGRHTFHGLGKVDLLEISFPLAGDVRATQRVEAWSPNTGHPSHTTCNVSPYTHDGAKTHLPPQLSLPRVEPLATTGVGDAVSRAFGPNTPSLRVYARQPRAP